MVLSFVDEQGRRFSLKNRSEQKVLIKVIFRAGTSGMEIVKLIDEYDFFVEGSYFSSPLKHKPIEVNCLVDFSNCDVIMTQIAQNEFVESVSLSDKTVDDFKKLTGNEEVTSVN